MLRTLAACLIASFSLAACTTYSSLHTVNGNAYLLGDTNCERYRAADNQLVQCVSSKGIPGELRRPLNQQEIQIYYMNQQIAAQQSAQMAAQLSAGNQNLSNMKFPTYSPPAVSPIPNYRNTVTCINAGIYTQCRY